MRNLSSQLLLSEVLKSIPLVVMRMLRNVNLKLVRFILLTRINGIVMRKFNLMKLGLNVQPHFSKITSSSYSVDIIKRRVHSAL